MIERFYIDAELMAHHEVSLKGNEHHHLSRVLRIREGEEIELVNGLGSLARAHVNKIDKEEARLRISHVENRPQPIAKILLGIPFMRPSKLEWVIEKGTELGCDAFYLYEADHSTQKSLSEHQIERFRAITISALKQSGRLYLPHLEILPHLESLLMKEAQVFFGDTRENAPPLHLEVLKPTLFITGPESGFSKEELEQLIKKGKGVRINQNILRAETAPLAFLSLLSFSRMQTD